MALKSVIGSRGLFTSVNTLTAPDGGLAICTNVSLARADILGPTRGLYGGDSSTFGTSSDRSSSGVYFDGYFVIHYGTTLARQPIASSATAYTGSFSKPGAQGSRLPIRLALALDSLYFTEYTGVWVLDSVTGTPALAGVPKALEPEKAQSGVTGNPDAGWMPEDSQVTYRIVWGIKDANGVVKLGAPSGRCVIVNPADFTAAIGAMTRTGGATVTVTSTTHGIPYGPTIVMAISPGEANFAAANETLTVASSTSFTYSDAGANTSNTAIQTFSSGSKNVALRILIPDGITTSHFYRVYRSLCSDEADIVADDECFLVYEAAPSSSDISNGYVSFTDVTPETLVGLGSPLYTNENTGDGILQAHERPPQAQDVVEWDGRLWLANLKDRRRFHLQLLGVGSPDGIVADDTITIGSTTLTAKASPANENQFAVVTSQTPARNVEATARALVACINKHSTLDVQAFYVSGENDVPGKMLIEKEDLAYNQTEFAVYASRVTSWHPALTTSSTGAQTSNDDEKTNGLAYSRQGLFDAFPLVNRLEAGPKNAEIRRIVPLRDKLLVFPSFGGIYAVSKPWPYRVDLLDGTATILAASSAVPHANQVYAWTTQGVVAISEGGTRAVSGPVDDDLRAIVQSGVSPDYALAISYESERTYSLWIPESIPGAVTGDGRCEEAFVYDSLHDTWEARTGAVRWGQVEPLRDFLVTGASDTNGMRIERKSFARQDNKGDRVAVTITDVDGTTITCASVASATAGDLLWQTDSLKSVIESVDVDSNTLVTRTAEAFTADAAELHLATACEVKWLPFVGQSPAQEMQLAAIHLHFRELCCHEMTVTFDSDVGAGEATETLSATGFGVGAWGSTPWGNDLRNMNRRIGVPIQHARSTQLRVGIRIREAESIWALHGFTPEYEPSGTRGGD